MSKLEILVGGLFLLWGGLHLLFLIYKIRNLR